MADKVRIEVVTPLRLLMQAEADLVVVPGGDGDFGVLPGHAPLLSTVRPGTIEIHEGGKVVERIFVEGGFADVTGESCTVIADGATPLAELTAADADARGAASRERLQAATTDAQRRDGERDQAVAEAMRAALAQRSR